MIVVLVLYRRAFCSGGKHCFVSSCSQADCLKTGRLWHCCWLLCMAVVSSKCSCCVVYQPFVSRAAVASYPVFLTRAIVDCMGDALPRPVAVCMPASRCMSLSAGPAIRRSIACTTVSYFFIIQSLCVLYSQYFIYEQSLLGRRPAAGL